ncbi:hypothetical protein [Parabacteroides sp.]
MYRVIVFFLCFAFAKLSAQDLAVNKFRQCGYENIRAGSTETGYWITVEDRVHRSVYKGIDEAVKILLEIVEEDKDVDLILLNNRIPQLKIHLSNMILKEYRQNEISVADVMKRLDIGYDTDNYRSGEPLKKPVNPSAGRIDLVFYPQIGLANYRLDKLYVVDISLAPALEMQLWPGARFTGQVVFPVYNNLKGEVDYIRPGILALSQSFRMRDNVFGSLHVGNFSDNRMGTAVELGYRSDRGYWGIGGEAGLTGSSTFYNGRWEVSNWKRVNFALKGYAYVPVWNVRFDVSVGQYVYGDRGGRFDCMRYFGEVAVGLYAMYSGREVNGGFNFSVPLPGRKRKRSRSFPVRVMLPEYFDWEYEAQSGPDYKNRKLGRTYRVHPERNRDWYNPLYIKGNLVNNN